MTDREALYRAICTSPDEDTLRLAFADFLEEQGTARGRLHARFIRVQIEMQRYEEQHPAWRKLFAEERKLITRVIREKLLPLDHLEKRRAGNIGYERGFIGFLTVYAKRFLAEADRYYADDPIQTVRFAKLSAKHGTVAPTTLFSSPPMSRLRTLELSRSGLTDSVIAPIANSPNLTGLRSLGLSYNNLLGHELRLLFDSPNLSALTHLDLYHNESLGDEGVVTLASRPGFRRLKRLYLDLTGVTIRGVQAIAESPHSSGLEVLRLGSWYGARVRNESNSGIAQMIASSPHLSNLKELELVGYPIGLDGLSALGNSPHLQLLRRLKLRCGLPARAVPLAAAAPNFRNLYQLVLGIHRESYRRPIVDPIEEKAIREVIPEAAIRFE